jgi:hypothetical protein
MYATESFRTHCLFVCWLDLAGDYFAVRITEDPVYGTPVFTTMGGQSKCPGESGTNRRESQVSIVGILPRCANTGECTNVGLPAGTKAHYGVIIQNISPTGMYVYMYVVSSSRLEA